MSVLFIVILGRIYVVVVAFLVLNLVSRALFGKIKIRLRGFMTSLLLIPLWPVAILSTEGRKALLAKIKTL